jgi:hypothetical protein
MLIYYIGTNNIRRERKKMIKSNRNRYRGNFASRKIVFGTILVGIMMVFGAIGCSSGPSQSPEQFVKGFIAKRISMVDLSTADFYVKEERSGIRELISQSIQSKKDEGILDFYKNASYDLSQVKVEILAKKTDYVNDEEANYVKLQAKGNFTLTQGDKSQSLNEDEIFVLRSVGNEWKLTEKDNPWG